MDEGDRGRGSWPQTRLRGREVTVVVKAMGQGGGVFAVDEAMGTAELYQPWMWSQDGGEGVLPHGRGSRTVEGLPLL